MKLKSVSWKLWEKYIFIIFIILLPFQFGKHFWPGFSLLEGVRVDYLAPVVYLTDLVSLGFIPFLINYLRVKKIKLTPGWVVLLMFFALNLVFSVSPWVAFFRILKALQVMIIILFVRHTEVDFKKDFFQPLFIVSAFVSLIGIGQFMTSSSFGGLLYFLGERNINISAPGIALVNVFNNNYLRAYSTFSHPNSMAGFLGAVLLISIFNFKKTFKFIAAFLVVLIGIFLTFSQGVILALIIVFIGYVYQKKHKLNIFLVNYILLGTTFLMVFLGSIIFTAGYESIDLRLLLSAAAIKITAARPIFGTGFGNFVIELPKYLKSSGFWYAQPVHNIYLLLLAETGIVGLLLALEYIKSVIIKIKNNKVYTTLFVFILLTGLLDHYWFTLQQNVLLLSVLLGFFTNKLVQSKNE